MSSPQPAIRCVLFDLDGTLIQSPIDFGRMRSLIITEVERDLGEALPDAEGRDLLALIEETAARSRQPELFRSRCEDLLLEVERDASKEAREVEGAGALLEVLAERGLAVGIVTRNSPHIVRPLLRQFPLRHRVLLTRADTPRVKPDPIHLRLALDYLGEEPGASLMVGDHIMDVQAGRAAGMRTAGFLAEGRPPDYFVSTGADGVFTHLANLVPWIFQSSSSTGIPATS